MPRGSKVLGPMRPLNPGSEGSISYHVLASHPAYCCHRVGTHTARLRKAPERPWALPGAGAADFENAVAEHRRCNLQRSPWNQVNGALRADDIVHETEAMRSSDDLEPEYHGRVLTDTMPT